MQALPVWFPPSPNWQTKCFRHRLLSSFCYWSLKIKKPVPEEAIQAQAMTFIYKELFMPKKYIVYRDKNTNLLPFVHTCLRHMHKDNDLCFMSGYRGPKWGNANHKEPSTWNSDNILGRTMAGAHHNCQYRRLPLGETLKNNKIALKNDNTLKSVKK